jgi:segregation and condensation protein A
MSEPTDTAGPAGVTKGQPASEREVPSAVAGYQVNLPTFEGPLDLLLHLITEHKLDILDIPIAFVSQKYVEYIMLLQDLNIDLASEYLVMAATLAHIKSKMLLPAPPEGQDDEPGEELDPRAELVRRLLEYQKYKHASEELLAAPVLGRDVFLRGPTAQKVEGEAPLAPVSVFKLLDAFQRLLGRVKQTADHFIDVDRISISERILQIVDQLEGKGPTVFDELLVGEITKADLVVTFLALLEMTRLRMMQILQAGPLSPLYVELTLSDEQQKVLRRDPGDGDPLAALMGGDDVAPEDPERSTEPEPDDAE